MDNNLLLPSFEVDGYRAIRHLWLPVLGQVNLFVGTNNSGKTSVLEAIRLYLHRNSRSLPLVVYETIQKRSGYLPLIYRRERSDVDPAEMQAVADAAETLFHGSFGQPSFYPIWLRPEPMPSTGLTLRLPWATDEAAGVQGVETPGRPTFLGPESAVLEMRSETLSTDLSLELLARGVFPAPRRESSPAVMIAASGMEPSKIRTMWDRVALAGDEGLVEDALRATVVPNLDRILLIGESAHRSVLLKLDGTTRPVPLQSMGDGVVRVFGIALALVEAREGALLVDEVENGLHFTVQDEVWQAIVTLSKQFNVQVFATTHSWDAVVGFQYAVNQSEVEGVLYRLDRKQDDRIIAVRYTEQDIAIAAEQRIEVR